ncbi:rod shape-determining protein MreD [Roseovarius sp. TE539]|uniref:rod shape-determining protein MreD n=1 Tax=Roseovarius sp. TE539 TaxID=2249812 RepID=UPI000DDDBBFA|nr:rod shape-determining protein MreD [Roseovarius sp. TE539]RBI70299.1 rod shape-determining protein MreD [Roseovarius sp. TE539]
MAERNLTRLWTMRAIFVGICLTLMFLRLLPLDTIPRGWAGPDLILAITFVWVLRRPEYAPPLLIAGVMLLADLMFQRPPGLWAALVVIGSEMLKSRAPGLRNLSFPAEWATVATLLVAIVITYRLVLSLLLVDQAPLTLNLMQLFLTLAVYPLVVMLSGAVFGVRKIKPSDADGLDQGA